MLIVMHRDATAQHIERVCQRVQQLGYRTHAMPGAQRTAVCVTGNPGPIAEDNFAGLAGIRELIRVSKPYKLASREFRPEPTTISVGGGVLGGAELQVIAGPCCVETESSTLRIAEQLAELGVGLFRAGAFKPRSSPYAFQGLGPEGLAILQRVKEEFGMAVVTEALDGDMLPAVAEVADIVQVGARNMHNTSLLKRLGRIDRPVLLKRGLAATLDELLMAAEYILDGGNDRVLLCERGIRTCTDHSRFTLDLAAIPALQGITHLPVVADPSHAAGRAELVAPLALAAVAAGARTLLIEVHDDPAAAWCDGPQALRPGELAVLLQQARAVAEAAAPAAVAAIPG